MIPDNITPENSFESNIIPYYHGNIQDDDIIWLKFYMNHIYDQEKLYKLYRKCVRTAKKVLKIIYNKFLTLYKKKKRLCKNIYP